MYGLAHVGFSMMGRSRNQSFSAESGSCILIKVAKTQSSIIPQGAFASN